MTVGDRVAHPSQVNAIGRHAGLLV